MKISFALQSYQDISKPVSSQRLVNAYLSYAPADAKTQTPVVGTPGLQLFSTAGTGSIRGMTVFKGELYVVSGSELYKINNQGTATKVGDLGFQGGLTPIVSSDINGCIVEVNGDIYYFNETSVTKVTDLDVRPASDVDFIDGFFVFTEKESDRTFSSGLRDVTSYDALDFATVEGSPDTLVGCAALGRQMWYFGTRSVQVYANVGTLNFPLAPVNGVLWQRGCAARDTIARTDNALFWLGDDYQVYMSNGYAGEVISTRPISSAIENYTNIADAFGFTYTESGDRFYILTFPSEGVTWGFNINTGAWHERSTSDTNGRWRPNAIVNCYGRNFVGDFENGKVYELSLNYFTDNGAEIIREAVSPNQFNEYKRLTWDEVLIDVEAGVGINTGQGSDPQLQLSWSDDGGFTFGNFITRSVGKIGQYQNRCVFQGLGQARQRVYKVKYSEPTAFRLNGAYARVRVGNS